MVMTLRVNLSSNIPANRPTTFDNFNAQGGYDLLVKVKPDEPNVVFIGGTNLWRSTDGFTDSNTVQIGGYFEGSDHGYGNWDIQQTSSRPTRPFFYPLTTILF